MLVFFISFILILGSSIALAQELPEDPVIQTQKVLTNPEARKKAIEETKGARDADQAALGVAGSQENLNNMYQVSSEILPIINKMADGDQAKMMQLLSEAQKNPEKFYNSLPENLRNQIRGIAKESEQNKSKSKRKDKP